MHSEDTRKPLLLSRSVNKSKVLTALQALDLMRQRGYIIKEDAAPAYIIKEVGRRGN